MVSTDWDGVRDRATVLDGVYPSFGGGTGPWPRSSGLEPPLTDTQVREAEQDLGIALPADYREFLLRVGAGGIGPGWMRTLRRGPDGWGWAGDTQTDRSRLGQPFSHPDSYQVYEDELDDREPRKVDYASLEDFPSRMAGVGCGVRGIRSGAHGWGCPPVRRGMRFLHPAHRHRARAGDDVVRPQSNRW
ncbi:SMI1/KNR4 family protein [Micromonospora sp. DT47]|uniref:SMI1/KNR4 family protein n=1 Tax=Micromonospora sp. DT47 TaxID=3393431 RepID=UPI003CE7E242